MAPARHRPVDRAPRRGDDGRTAVERAEPRPADPRRADARPSGDRHQSVRALHDGPVRFCRVDQEFSDEEAELRDNVRSVLAGICPPSVVRGIYENKGEPAGVWEQMVELHWPALTIPEEHEGLGLGFVEVAIVAEELGRATVPAP